MLTLRCGVLFSVGDWLFLSKGKLLTNLCISFWEPNNRAVFPWWGSGGWAMLPLRPLGP